MHLYVILIEMGYVVPWRQGSRKWRNMHSSIVLLVTDNRGVHRIGVWLADIDNLRCERTA